MRARLWGHAVVVALVLAACLASLPGTAVGR